MATYRTKNIMKRATPYLFGVISICAQAAYLSESELRADFSNNRVEAVAYIAGAVDAMNGRYFCIPKSVAKNEIVALIEENMSAHISRYNVEASWLIKEVLKKKFPCREVP